MASPTDLRGLPSGTASAAARDAAELALWRMLSSFGSPLDDLDAAAAADPAWAMPHVMRAGHLLALGDPALLPQAADALALAGSLAAPAPAREQAHLQAVAALLEGGWRPACERWGVLLIDSPLDALALHAAHHWDTVRGDRSALRSRPAGALPAWSTDDPLYPHVLARWSCALAENNLFVQAEDAARLALQCQARVPLAVIAAARAMQLQGRFDEGSAWLRQHQDTWADDSTLAVHLWWQMALFRIEAMDLAGAQRLVDSHFVGAALHAWSQRVDAASLLWRLHLLGVDMRARFGELLAGWQPDPAQAGGHALGDLHVVLAHLGAGDLGGAERWIAGCARRALAVEDGRCANHRVARDVGLPLMRGMVALERGDAAAATALMLPVRNLLPRLGGSQVQRELVDLSLLRAAGRGAPPAPGRAILNERLMAMPATPLTRHWCAELGTDEEARA